MTGAHTRHTGFVLCPVLKAGARPRKKPKTFNGRRELRFRRWNGQVDLGADPFARGKGKKILLVGKTGTGQSSGARLHDAEAAEVANSVVAMIVFARALAAGSGGASAAARSSTQQLLSCSCARRGSGSEAVMGVSRRAHEQPDKARAVRASFCLPGAVARRSWESKALA